MLSGHPCRGGLKQIVLSLHPIIGYNNLHVADNSEQIGALREPAAKTGEGGCEGSQMIDTNITQISILPCKYTTRV